MYDFCLKKTYTFSPGRWSKCLNVDSGREIKFLLTLKR